MLEKPTEPALGLHDQRDYFVADSTGLFDALALMIDRGVSFGTFDVVNWYDCGLAETLLEANWMFLETHSWGHETETSVIVPPVDVGEDVVIEQSVVGPYVSVDDGSRIENSRVENTIVGAGSELYDINLAEALVGASTTVTGTPTRLNVGDSSELHL
jgi:glucose-1-phosphate thymidylyltransferase